VEYCPECNGAGDRIQDFWREGKGRLTTCKRCNGRGYIWV
jgi:DnaJ-class molecular chaperone